MLSLDSALVPYQPNEKIQQDDTNQDFNFDLLQLITDAENDPELVLAATQIENSETNTTKFKTTMMTKCNSPRKPQVFSGCTFGNIGTLNIHIHRS